MNLALPTPPAVALVAAGSDSQEGLPLVSATTQGLSSGSVLNVPLFIDVLSQVLPPSMFTQSGVEPQDTGARAEVVQSTLPAGQAPGRDDVPVDEVNLATLPTAWETGAWGGMLGVAFQGGAQEQDTHAGNNTKERTTDEVALTADHSPGQVAAVPWLLASLQPLNSGLSSVVAVPSGDGAAAGERGLALQGVSSAGLGMPRGDTLPSMASLIVRPPATAAEVAATPAEGGPLPEQEQPVSTTTSAMSDRAAALIQSSGTLQQAGDAAQPLALNPRQPDLWQRPLAQALGERLQVQGAQGEEQALIRLDPPSLGRVEIVLRQEGGTWQVQLSATHPEVSRQLQAISETLRHELSVRQQASVTVQVTSDHLGHADGRQQRQRQDGQQPREPGQAWDGEEASQTFDLA